MSEQSGTPDTAVCPAADCETIVGRGVMYSSNKSKWCDHFDRHVHSHCDGVARIIDQDGHSRYTCKCYCHSERAERGGD